MDSGKKEFNFFWSIENYSYCPHQNGEVLISPHFTTEGLERTAWNLQLYPRGMRDEDRGYVSLFLYRSAEDDGPRKASVHYELSLLKKDGSPFYSYTKDYSFKRGNGYGRRKGLKRDEIVLQREANILPQDTLTVRCKIWKGEGNVQVIGLSSARTRFKVKKISFLHEAERFSTLRPNVKLTIEIPSCSKEKSFISSSLYVTEGLCCEEKIMIEILPTDPNLNLRKCELYLLDKSGKKVGCGEADNRYDIEGKRIHTLPLSFTRKAVLNRKNEFLPDDKLTLLCECTFSSGLELETEEEIRHETYRAAVKPARYQMPSMNGNETVEKPSAYPSALKELKALYINKSLTDVELKTKTKSFPAHKLVLCARSPVFRRMLSSDMAEKNTDSVFIDDLEDDVVEQFLLFLYSDTVENLEWTMATRLYYSADKYQVGRLKEVCSSFLVANLTPSNAGELLFLADTHSDADLKGAVEEFILKNEEGVFGSDEWEKLMKANPLFFMKAMLSKYKRRKLE